MNPLTVLAVEEDANPLMTAQENRKLLPVQSDSYKDWPSGPRIGAEAAILIDADSGIILYEKNIHEKLYPASITKILTTLIGAESCELNETVTFSYDAVNAISRDSSNAGLDANEAITVEQCLYAILVGSANEAANGLGEHIAGSMSDFADIMNKRAKELGCIESHFVTTNGLHDEDHYTSAYDMAQIGRAFFSNEILCRMASTPTYHIPKSDTQPDDNLYLHSKNQLYEGGANYYEYLVGSKTGYTDHARQTLVSCAEKDGMKLICVVLKEESPYQFVDTVTLFNYGFENFKRISISDGTVNLNSQSSNFFSKGSHVFGEDRDLFKINDSSFVTIPANASFDELDSVITTKNIDSDSIARLNYFYNDIPVGSATISLLSSDNTETLISSDEYYSSQNYSTVYLIDVLKLIEVVVIVSLILIVLLTLKSMIDNYQFSKRRRRKKKKPRPEQISPYKRYN